MTFGEVDAGFEYAEATDDSVRADSESFGVSLGRDFGENVRIVGGWRHLDSRYTGNLLPFAPVTRETSDGIVIEITLSG